MTGPRRLRVGYLRIAQESNGWSPRRTELSDFAIDMAGAELHAATGPRGIEAPGFLANAELSGFRRAVERHGGGRIEAVPLFSLWAVPGGPLTVDAVEGLRARLLAAMDAAGPLDGLFVSLHGAMAADGMDEPEASLLATLRERVGPHVRVAVTVDLHALLTPRFVASLDLLAAYRTNPHRDHAKTGERCGKMLIDTLLGRLRPTLAWRTLPMSLGGGDSLDFRSPLRSVFRWMARAERDPNVAYVSLCMCQMWLTSPDLGWSVVVITHDDPAKAERLADALADRAWATRHALPSPIPSAEEAIAQARAARWARRLGTVCLCDASDIVGAGAPGDNTRLLAALLEHARGLTVYSALRDDAAVAELWKVPVGSDVALTLGGSHPDSPPLPVRGRLRSRETTESFGRVALLDLGHVQLVLTSAPPLVMKPDFYTDRGLSIWRADICVVKSLYPFRVTFLLTNRKTIFARTRGPTDFDTVWRNDYRLPTSPKHEVADWRPADAVRRLGRAP